MGIEGTFQFFNQVLAILFLDLLLSGDNAVVIALACRSLPLRERRQAMFIGTIVAIVLRVVLTLIASILLTVPLLELLGAIALVVIAVRLTVDERDTGNGNDDRAPQGGPNSPGLAAAVGTVILADLVMSTDNVVALAAVSKGSVTVLVLGLLLSLPLLMSGSWYITGLLFRYPVLIQLGGAILGWVAGDIGVADPLYANWIQRQSPALTRVVPALVAGFVLVQSRIIGGARASAAGLRPVTRAKTRPATPGQTADLGSGPDAGGVATQDLLGRKADPESIFPAEAPAPRLTTVENNDVRAGATESDQTDTATPERVQRTRFVSKVLLAGTGCLLAGVAGYWLLNIRWMPVPAEPIRYECTGKDVSVFYRVGQSRIRIAAGAKSVTGVVQRDNQIQWHDDAGPSKGLGFAPPAWIAYATAETLHFGGGALADVACNSK